MKIVLRLFGALLIIFGAIWFLQGINILPGSFMTGQTQWAVIGGVSFGAGILTIISSHRT